MKLEIRIHKTKSGYFWQQYPDVGNLTICGPEFKTKTDCLLHAKKTFSKMRGQVTFIT